MEEGALAVGDPVDVPTTTGFWQRKVATIGDADFCKISKTDEYMRVAIAGSEPAVILVYFGSQPPGRDIVYPGTLEGESAPNSVV